ncbi:MAG: glutamate synthase subunit beta [Saprospiraceae bacterium]|nr:glutamate synthase subunit beta [Saprospiraceae bacterium]
MGNPTGFIEHTRQLPGKQAVPERLRHYGEFIHRYEPKELNRQAARCMDCGVPFCHNGCPLGNIIPEFNDAVYRGRWQEAYDILTSTNNFPEFTGRICPAPCESACVLGINQPPVAIEEIEKHIVEIAFERGLVKARKILDRTGKKVAVIGSGPAGLAAAAQLNAAGHSVTVLERDDAPGGLLRYGIPDFKLEKWVLDRRIALLEAEGIEFRCNVEIGSEAHPVGDLLREYHAVALCIGATVPRDLPAPGRALEGVHLAMDFLKQQNQRVRAGKPLEFTPADISAAGKHVVVIGGGDTGSDCVGTSNRQGAASVTQFELLPMPPQERAPHSPWPTYPMLYKVTSSHEEGCERQFAIQTKAFLGDAQGRLRALQVVDLRWESGPDGRPASFVEVPGSEREIPCQLALLAMGFLHPQKEGLLEQLELALDARHNIHAPESTYQTNIPRVFCAGDARRGQSLVVWAISEGRECARQVDAFLMGETALEGRDG